MLIRNLATAALLALAPVSLLPTVAPAQSLAPVPSSADLLQAAAMDQIFTQFGPTFETAPANSPVPLPAGMAEVWRQTARQVFEAERMHADLVDALEGRFSAAEAATIMDFFGSPAGRRVSATDRAMMLLDAERLQHAIAAGEDVLSRLGRDSRRRQQLDEMLELAGADISVAMTAQSLRGMFVAIALAPQRGDDIEIPWSEIDAQLDLVLGDVEADIAATQLALAAFSYRDISEAELDACLDFLRQPAARKFYGFIAVAVGTITGDAMVTFGETFAANLAKVGA